MKRCPKCNRTYSTDTQKFCTHDGGLLFMIDEGLHETVQFDSSKVRDAVQKPTTRDLGDQKPPGFDPEATVVTATDGGTQQVKARDTGSLGPGQPTQYQTPPPAESPSDPLLSLTSTPAPNSESGPSATSAPLPPPQASPSGPITPSGPLPAQAQPSQPLAAPAKKKSKLPLVLVIVAVLLIFFVGAAAVAGYFLVYKPRQEARRVVTTTPSEPTRTNPSVPTTETPSEPSQPTNEPPPYSAPADAIQFLNSKDNLDGRLLEHYVDFSFYYPNAWVKDATAGVSGASNFAKVERRLPPDFTQENFAVGWFSYSSSGSAEGDRALYHDLSENLSAKLAPGFPEYRKVSEGPTRAGAYDGYEFRFEAMSRGTAKGDVKIWGRVIFVHPPNGGDTGVTLLMLATSLAPELESVDDIGAKGELPMLLESFRFGKQ